MNKFFVKLLFGCFICVIFFTSCDKYPISALLGLPDPVGSWPNPWYLYDDQWNTKGSPDPEHFNNEWDNGDDWSHAKLDTNCMEYPQSGTRCIKFSWIGNVGRHKKTFFGFGMPARIKSGEKIDLSNSGYKFLKCWVRGTLSNNCAFEIEIPGATDTPIKFDSSNIPSVWTEYTTTIKDNVGEVQYILAMSLKTDGGTTNGGTVYIDNIRLTKD